MTRDKSWMDKQRDSVEWQTGMKNFLNLAFDGAQFILLKRPGWEGLSCTGGCIQLSDTCVR